MNHPGAPNTATLPGPQSSVPECEPGASLPTLRWQQKAQTSTHVQQVALLPDSGPTVSPRSGQSTQAAREDRWVGGWVYQGIGSACETRRGTSDEDAKYCQHAVCERDGPTSEGQACGSLTAERPLARCWVSASFWEDALTIPHRSLERSRDHVLIHLNELPPLCQAPGIQQGSKLTKNPAQP